VRTSDSNGSPPSKVAGVALIGAWAIVPTDGTRADELRRVNRQRKDSCASRTSRSDLSHRDGRWRQVRRCRRTPTLRAHGAMWVFPALREAEDGNSGNFSSFDERIFPPCRICGSEN
jgi:hypothetical protein